MIKGFGLKIYFFTFSIIVAGCNIMQSGSFDWMNKISVFCKYCCIFHFSLL